MYPYACKEEYDGKNCNQVEVGDDVSSGIKAGDREVKVVDVPLASWWIHLFSSVIDVDNRASAQPFGVGVTAVSVPHLE